MVERRMVTRPQPEENRRQHKTLWILGAVVGFFLLLWVLFAPGRGIFQYIKLKKQVADLSEENSRLEARNIELSEDIKRLRSDDKYLEEVARKKHGLLKKNETVFEFEPPKKKKE